MTLTPELERPLNEFCIACKQGCPVVDEQHHFDGLVFTCKIAPIRKALEEAQEKAERYRDLLKRLSERTKPSPSEAKRAAHEALHILAKYSTATDSLADYRDALMAVHAAIDALADAIGEPDQVEDGEVEVLEKRCHDLHEHILVEHADMDRNAKECDLPHECHNRLEIAIGKLASLARRGRGHARNCECCSAYEICCERIGSQHLASVKHPFTDPRCAPLSEGARARILQYAKNHGCGNEACTHTAAEPSCALQVESALAGGER